MSRSQIEEARTALQRWDARVEEDTAALVASERQVMVIRERLAASTKASNMLRDAIEQWEAIRLRGEGDAVD